MNPRMTVEDIIGEALDIHKLARGKSARQQRVAELLQAGRKLSDPVKES